jgi:hypothetical protein
MEIFIGWIFFSVVVGIGANTRGRHGWGWGLLALLISPLFAGALLLALPRLSNTGQGRNFPHPDSPRPEPATDYEAYLARTGPSENDLRNAGWRPLPEGSREDRQPTQSPPPPPARDYVSSTIISAGVGIALALGSIWYAAVGGAFVAKPSKAPEATQISWSTLDTMPPWKLSAEVVG